MVLGMDLELLKSLLGMAHDEPLGDFMKACNCICGGKSTLKSYDGYKIHLVKCNTGCWIGKSCSTEEEAIKQWNRIMVVAIGIEAAFGTTFDDDNVECEACSKAGRFQFCEQHLPY